MLKLVITIISLSLPLLGNADQRIIADSFLAGGLAPSSVTPMTSDGFWAGGISDTLPALVRYNADGTVGFVRFPFMSGAKSLKLAAMPDGGVVSTDIEYIDVFDQACKLRRFDAQGDQLWISDLAQPFYIDAGPSCSNVYIDGVGGIWLFPSSYSGSYVTKVNLDGSPGAQIPWPVSIANQIVADPMQSAVYMAGAVGTPETDPTSTLAALSKITPQGVAWSISVPAQDVDSVLDDIVLGNDGTLWAFGQEGAKLFGTHVTAAGSLIWSNAVTTSVKPTNVKVAARADGGVSTLHWDPSALQSSQANSAPELTTFSAAGQLLWQTSTAFSPSASPPNNFVMAPAQSGDVVVAQTFGVGTAGTNLFGLQQLRVNDTGKTLFTTPVQPLVSQPGLELHVLPDNSSLAVTGVYTHLSANGTVLPGPQSSAITTATSLDENETIAPDGSTYLLVINADSKSFGVSAYSSAGALRWHTPVQSSWTNGGLTGAILTLRADDICIVGSLDGNYIVQCFALADGMAEPQLDLAPMAATTTFTIQLQAVATTANKLVVLYRAADGTMHHALIDDHNTLVHDIAPLMSGETWVGSGQGSNGDSVIITSTTTLLKLSADGSRAYSVTTDLPFGSAKVAPDGSAILTCYNSPLALEYVDANGNRLWQNTLPSGPNTGASSLRQTANDLYLMLYRNIMVAGTETTLDGLVVKVSMADGSVEWYTSLPYVFGQPPTLILDTNSGHVLALSTFGDHTQIRQFNMADGTLAVQKNEPCDVDECTLSQAILATDGTIRLVHDTTDFYSGSAWEITIMQNEFDKIFADGFEG